MFQPRKGYPWHINIKSTRVVMQPRTGTPHLQEYQHRIRSPPRQAARGKPLPARSALADPTQAASLQQRVEQFLFHQSELRDQSELLDEKQWGAYIDLFADEGVYWMPVTRE
jgi:hypothetical protein